VKPTKTSDVLKDLVLLFAFVIIQWYRDKEARLEKDLLIKECQEKIKDEQAKIPDSGTVIRDYLKSRVLLDSGRKDNI